MPLVCREDRLDRAACTSQLLDNHGFAELNCNSSSAMAANSPAAGRGFSRNEKFGRSETRAQLQEKTSAAAA